VAIRIVFVFLVLLALLGDARIFLYILNRLVFGGHRDEQSPWKPLIFIVPPLLLVLTLLFWPMNRWIERLLSTNLVERVAPARIEQIDWTPILGKIGASWLIVAAVVGGVWILERIRANSFGEVTLTGTRTLPPEVIRLRRAHIPFASIQRLGAHNDVYDIEITKHELFIDRLPEAFDGYRIAFLTDTHVAPIIRPMFYRNVVAQVGRFDPDLVLLGGDFVSFNRHIKLMAEVLLADLKARDGVRAVLGNHDYWSKGDEVQAAMEARGVEFVTNRSIAIRRGDAQLQLVGIDEIYRGTPDVDAAFAGVDAAHVTLGLSHHPDVIDLLGGRTLDLLVCGHTHGGQIRFPFFGAIVVPSRHEQEYAAGFHRVGNVLMYVSRGLGSLPPLRILCRPELATFVLRRGRRTS
jgi:predicted MPP superfamily phosphohydrolase